MSLSKPKDSIIYRNRLIQELLGIRDTLGDMFLANIMDRAIACVASQPEVNSEYIKKEDKSE